ncbi:outer membrane protein OmpK [Vibrio sp. SCSIO 43137]|uniref:outer membrane protein OmpK n=1 Tax=Vibrio sp. SCSIO 43137 TaxID=3021011 RepID=UPI002307E81F|nr:outer membrane protein OmpK [Vibrio sp. SCSIO 43137]WCE29080.1 outer membrane protein OmpK [Vibrio sp. SCSIO 43137]
MRKSIIALGVMAAAAAVPAQAEYLFGFGNMYVDYQMWNHGIGNDKSNFGQEIDDRNQAVIGIDGGAVFDWGQIYGFYDYEGVDRGGDNRGASAKGTIHYNLTDSGVTLYAQVYNTDKDKGPTLHEQNRVIGLGYTGLKGDGWGVSTFLGVHHINTEGSDANPAITGNNGGMAGWVGYYNTEIGGEKFTFSTWGELEFARNKRYSDVQSTEFANGKGSESWGLNGSVNAMWNFHENWSTGVLYRYTVNKLGRRDYQDIVIYRLQYAF